MPTNIYHYILNEILQKICDLLFQVSGMQGFSVHKRIRKRIHDLLDMQMIQLADMLMSEEKYVACYSYS